MSPAVNYIMHIPKTAGMSLQHLVRRRHKDEDSLELIYTLQKQLDGFEDRASLKTVMGHYRYGIQRFSKRPAHYYTFLRNPIDHVISHYQYTKDFPEKFEALPEGISSVIDFAKCAYGDNLQCRFVSGITRHDTDLSVILDEAKKNLKTFKCIGITEEFDLSLLMFGKSLGWKNVFYTRMNAGEARKKHPKPNEAEIAELQQLLKYDLQLYKLGREIFEKQKRENPELLKKLAQFQRMNHYFQKLNPSYIRFKKLVGMAK